MKNYFIYLKLHTKTIVISCLLGSFILTGISMLVHKEEGAYTFKQGYLNEIEAQRMQITVHEYYGWPSLIFPPKFGILQYENLTYFIFGNLVGNFIILLQFVLTLIPNVVFWGSISLLIIIFSLSFRYLL